MRTYTVSSITTGVEESGGWSEHCTREGYSYYHNSQSGESQWEKPEGFSGQSQELSREEIQVGGRREGREEE